MTEPIAPITREERAALRSAAQASLPRKVTEKYNGSTWHGQSTMWSPAFTNGATPAAFLALDAFATAETARADWAESERKRHDAHMLEQLGQVAQERDSLRAKIGEIAGVYYAAGHTNAFTDLPGAAKAFIDIAKTLRAKIAESERIFTKTVEEEQSIAVRMQQERDAAIRERDKARHDCDHETRIRCDERDRRIAAEKRAEAAEARLADLDRALNAAHETADIERRDRRKMRDEKAEAEARCARMAGLLRKVHDWRGLCDANANETFERIADMFRRETGLLRPGKDEPAPGLARLSEDRWAAWESWVAKKNSEIDAEIRASLADPAPSPPAHPTRPEEGK